MPNALIIPVGARCSGKNHWADKALAKWPETLCLVKSNTTRPSRRDGVDERAYNFWTEKEFDEELSTGRMIQTGKHSGFRYGLHLPAIEAELNQKSGVLPLMPDAAEMAYLHFNPKFPVRIIILRPTLCLLLMNMGRRGIKDGKIILAIIKEDSDLRARTWKTPVTIFDLDGTAADEKILELFDPAQS